MYYVYQIEQTLELVLPINQKAFHKSTDILNLISSLYMKIFENNHIRWTSDHFLLVSTCYFHYYLINKNWFRTNIRIQIIDYKYRSTITFCFNGKYIFHKAIRGRYAVLEPLVISLRVDVSNGMLGIQSMTPFSRCSVAINQQTPSGVLYVHTTFWTLI